jgi:hypothetical protein
MVMMVILEYGSVFSDLRGRVTAVERFRHQYNKYDTTDGDEAERDAERTPYGVVSKGAGDEGPEESSGENSGDDPLEACCSGLANRKRLTDCMQRCIKGEKREEWF